MVKNRKNIPKIVKDLLELRPVYMIFSDKHLKSGTIEMAFNAPKVVIEGFASRYGLKTEGFIVRIKGNRIGTKQGFEALLNYTGCPIYVGDEIVNPEASQGAKRG